VPDVIRRTKKNMRLTLDREFYIPKDKDAIVMQSEKCAAICYLLPPGPGGKWMCKGFSGKRARPDFYYSFSDETRARNYCAEFIAGKEKSAAEKLARRVKITAEKCRTPLDVWNLVRTGRDYISAADTAICVRAALKRHFPEIKFSVTSENYSMGCAVRVSWTDGPLGADVNKITSRYSFAGFDGMIDMEYSKDRWLSRDGEMSLAHSESTGGSAGSCPESIGDPHSPDCVLVRGGAKYVTTSRHMSFAYAERLARAIAGKYGVAMPESFANENALWSWVNGCRVEWSCGAGEYLSTLMHREENTVTV